MKEQSLFMLMCEYSTWLISFKAVIFDLCLNTNQVVWVYEGEVWGKSSSWWIGWTSSEKSYYVAVVEGMKG